MAPDRRMIDPLLQCPLEMRHALRTASEAHLLTQIIPPPPAYTTLPTRYTDLEGNAITNGKV